MFSLFDSTKRSGSRPFTDDCREALQRATSEAHRLSTPFVGTEHLLLALIAQPDGEPPRLLTALGVKPAYVRGLLEKELAKHRGQRPQGADVPYTSRGKKVLELAIKEAQTANEPVGAKHLLVAVTAEDRSFSAQLLQRLGADAERLRRLCQNANLPNFALHVRIDDTSATVIYEQIIHQIKEAIATTRLQPGSRLPTVRELADDLGIAPGTVARAYSQLEEAGILVTDGARGTFVALPGRKAPATDQTSPIRDLLRPAIIAAYHLGATADDVRTALEQAMMDVFPDAA